jgi:hypothetical protein
MNLRTRLSRSNGYRELGMFDESILILEDIKLVKSSSKKDFRSFASSEKNSLSELCKTCFA